MSLYDEHLKQALRNAPDRELVPSDPTRAAVLAYAKQSLKPKNRSWFASSLGWLNSWHMENWQLASAGSVFASIMILVVFWHEQPKDAEWMPAESTQIATAELASDQLSEVAADAAFAGSSVDGAVTETQSENKSSSAKSPALAAQAKPAKGDTKVTQQAILPAMQPAAPRDKVIVAEATQLKDTSEIAADHMQVKQLAKKHEAPSALSPLTLETDKRALTSASEATERVAANSAPAVENDAITSGAATTEAIKHQPESVLSEPRVALMGRAESKRKTDGHLSPAGNIENASLAAMITKDGGLAVANRDIKNGLLRSLYLGANVPAINPQECAQLKPNHVPHVDAVTGYRVEFISGCYSTAVLMKEVEIYNQTMHAWFARGGK